jgi:hypothetical protein
LFAFTKRSKSDKNGVEKGVCVLVRERERKRKKERKKEREVSGWVVQKEY